MYCMSGRVCLVISLVCVSLVVAQSPEATIAGTITDSSGAAIAGAEVHAANLATAQRTVAVSNESGFYSLRALPIGQYTISVEKQGFRKHIRENLVLTTGQALSMDVTLEVGALTESVTVSAQASLLETRTSDQSQLVEARNVQDMPLGDRRTMNIVALTGAAVFINYDSGGKPNFSLAGGRTQSQNFYMDGGTLQNMRLGIGQVDTDPPVETVAEVKVLSNGFSAEYGGSAGGVIVASTKSGTNQFKGAAYWYLRNEKLDAGNFFAPWVDNEKVRAPLRYNIFGATIGGPVLLPKYNGKDKTFFYFAYEGSRRSQGDTDQFTVPTPLQAAGDFSQTYASNGTVIPIYDPITTRVEGGRNIRDRFPGNVIPTSRIDPVGKNLLPFYPAPNRAPDNITGVNNYRTNYVQKLTRDAYLIKGDHALSEKDRISMRYLYNSDDLDNTTVMTDAAAENRTQALRHQNFFYGTYTRIFSPSIINEFRFTYGNRINHARSYGLDGGWPTKLGLKGVPDDAFPGFNIAGYRTLSNANQERRQFPIQQFQYINNLSVIVGRHALKFGMEYRPSYNWEINRPAVSGNFTLSPLATGLPGNTATGYALASLLVGAPTGFNARETQLLDRQSNYWAWFAQDDWTLTRNLTLNFGVRWETDTPIVDYSNRMNGFDATAINPVSGTPGVVKFMGVDGFRTSPYDTDLNNFGPRFGFAYRAGSDNKTVVRGGFGAYFAHPFDAGVPTSASLGFEQSATINSPDNGVTIPFYLKDGVPPYQLASPVLGDSFGAVRFGATPNTAVTFYETNRRTGYSLQWNLSVQRELPGSILAEVSYLANLSRKLPSSNMSINQVLPEKLTPTSRQTDRPYAQFSNVSVNLPSQGVSSYNAMLLKAEKRFSGGWNFLTTYTWSKFLNNTNEGGSVLGAEGGVYSNFYNRKADFGYSENDVPHRWTFSGVYELPFGKGRKYLADSGWRYLVGGWNMGGLLTLQAGAPFTVTTQVNSVFSAAGALRANVAYDPNLDPGDRTLTQWFDTAAFTQPAAATFGNQGVNILRADGVINVNLSLARNFPLPGEGRSVQFRGEFFNLTNHPNFGLPGRVFGAPGFGVVSSAGPARSIQLGLRIAY